MKKIISSILLMAIVCLAVSSCGGSCKAKNDTVGQTESPTAASTPLESPTSTETPAKTEESTTPESTAPESSTVSPTSHYHEYSEIWSADEDGHWHQCKICIRTTKKEPHDFELHSVVYESTADKSGQAVHACKTCNFAYIGELLYAPEESK